jgi:sarcosine oxidase subunit gamma
MTEAPDRRHGLEPLLSNLKKNRKARIQVRIRHDLGHVNLRGNPGDDAFMGGAEAVLGQSLPVEPNTFTEDEQRICWLGPDEWLVLAPAAEINTLCAELEASLEGTHAAVNGQSGGQIAIELSGSDVRDVFARGCTLDFHRKVFRTGMCAQSGLARTNVLIGCLDDDRFDVVVRRSFSDYLIRWLLHAGGEFGMEVSTR